jgi:hypothetical protein
MLVALFLDHLRGSGCIVQDDYDPYLPIYVNPEKNTKVVIELIDDQDSYAPIQVAIYCDALKIARPKGYEAFPSLSLFMDLHEQVKNGQTELGEGGVN